MRFEKGNTFAVGKGRPPNRFTKDSLIKRCISEQEFNDLVSLVRRKAMGEDVEVDLAAAKIIIDCVPVARASTYIKQEALRGVDSDEKVDLAMENTLEQVGDGEMSIEDGLDVATLIEKRGVMLVKRELKELDEEKEKEDEL